MHKVGVKPPHSRTTWPFDVVHQRPRHHKDVEGLNDVVLEELLLQFTFAKLVEESELRWSTKWQDYPTVFVGSLPQQINQRVAGVFAYFWLISLTTSKPRIKQPPQNSVPAPDG